MSFVPLSETVAPSASTSTDSTAGATVVVREPTLAEQFCNDTLTPGQAALIPKLETFLKADGMGVFLLKGYAGTGKTFLMKGVVAYLKACYRERILLAPTGRAAKVLGTRVGERAGTMHGHLYTPRRDDLPPEEDFDDFQLVSELTYNGDSLDAVYIVDEASMVSDKAHAESLLQFGSGRLLADFLHFVSESIGPCRRKIIFVGDVAQLPPVHMSTSPALDERYLYDEFGLRAESHLLSDIVRQAEQSGIMRSALGLRRAIETGRVGMPPIDRTADDVSEIPACDMAEACWESMRRRLTKDSVMIAHTNRRVQALNRAFRARLFPGVETVTAGDKIMVILNTRLGGEFICNGDFGQVVRVGDVETHTVRLQPRAAEGLLAGPRTVELRFRDVSLRFRANAGHLFTVSVKILEDELEADEPPDLTRTLRALMIDFVRRHPGLTRGTDAWNDALATDPYLNAVHVRYGYAVTCHKSQGGEWETVYVDCAWRGRIASTDYHRWLYTAVTRAKTRLVLSNVPHTAQDDYGYGRM